MADQRSTGGLEAVRDELLANLERIGSQVRAGGDMADAVTRLFELRVVLMALPPPAAAMLAEEMQRTCEEIIKGADIDAVPAREALSLAVLQLDGHLRRSEAREHPEPLALLASINDLRQSRGVPPLSSAELLLPAPVPAQREEVSADSLAALVRLALKVRPHFHRYLVRWFNGDNPQEGLLGLSRLFNHMRRNVGQASVHELFLAAEAVVDGLLDGQIEADGPTKALLGRLDEVLKPLTARVPEWPADPAQALLGDLLARVAQLPPGAPAVQELERSHGRQIADDRDTDSLGQRTENGTAPMLDALPRELAAPSPTASAQVLAPRAHDTVAVTLQETRAALAHTRAAISSGRPAPVRSDQLADAYRSVQGLAEGLRGIGEAEPARLLDALAAQLRVRYLDPSQVPGEAGIELIDRALAAVEMHLEDRLERDVSHVRMIAEADYAIERLSGLLRPDAEVGGDSEAMDALPWSEASPTVRLELLNLFLDEAQDELAALRAQHKRWSKDRDDDKALSIMRRSLQTLKNSGSLVGARHLADLARSTAAVLERLLDGELPANLAAADFLADVLAMLPEIIDAESQRREPPTAKLIRAAEALLAVAPDTGGGSSPTRAPPNGAPAARDPGPQAHAAGVDVATPDGAAGSSTAQGSVDQRTALPQAGAADPPAARVPADEGLEALLASDDLLEVFAGEAEEIIDALDAQLREWHDRGPDADGVAAARRRLHTLKGSARMAGLAPVGDLSHAMESLLAGADVLPAAAGGPLTALLQRALDTLSAQITAAREGIPVVSPDRLLADLATASAGAHAGAAAASGGEAPGAPVEPALPAPTPAESAMAAATAGGDATPRSDDLATQLRVGAGWLDGIMNRAGEVGAFRARLVQQNARLGFRLAQLDDGLKGVALRLATLLERDREPPPPAGDASAVAAALLQEVRAVASAIGELQRDNAELLRQEARIAEAMQDELLQARMLPFGRVGARLARLVRRTAEGMNKLVELSLEGTAVALDRNVLQRFLPPLEHLLRNAVVHGIEPPEVRRASGKPATGRLSVAVVREGDDVIFEVADDGAGMDPAQLRECAVAQGLVAADAVLSRDEILSLTLRPGFSTAAEVTQDAGRGVGLDVVNTQVAALDGELELSSEPGQGVRFRVRLPLTLSMVEALLVSAADTLLAIPNGTTLAVARVAREQLIAGAAAVDYRGERFPVEPLAGALYPGAAPTPPPQRWLPVLLVAEGGERVAFQVDALLDSQRVAAKPIGPPLAALRWLSGGTVLADGRIALLADLPALLRSMRAQRDTGAPAERRAAVLVVNDSETVRRLAQRLVGRANIEVVSARDGIEAQAMLRQQPPDLLLVDLDMPRMNGLELTRWVRASDALRWLPVIMITSMVGEAERAEALAAGVDRFVATPFAEDELLAQVESLLMLGLSV